MLVRHLQGMLDVQLAFDEHDYEHASVIIMFLYHWQNMPQVQWCPVSQGVTLFVRSKLNRSNTYTDTIHILNQLAKWFLLVQHVYFG